MKSWSSFLFIVLLYIFSLGLHNALDSYYYFSFYTNKHNPIANFVFDHGFDLHVFSFIL